MSSPLEDRQSTSLFLYDIKTFGSCELLTKFAFHHIVFRLQFYQKHKKIREFLNMCTMSNPKVIILNQ